MEIARSSVLRVSENTSRRAHRGAGWAGSLKGHLHGVRASLRIEEFVNLHSLAEGAKIFAPNGGEQLGTYFSHSGTVHSNTQYQAS